MRAAIQTTVPVLSVVSVPPRNAADAIYEGIDLAIPLIVCITKVLPIQEMMRIKYLLKGKDMILIGPNSPGEMMLGIIPDMVAVNGNVGIVSRSGTLAYEVMYELSNYGIGISTFIGIGADPIVGFEFSDLLQFFEEDPHTEKMLLIGEMEESLRKKQLIIFHGIFQNPLWRWLWGNQLPQIVSWVMREQL